MGAVDDFRREYQTMSLDELTGIVNSKNAMNLAKDVAREELERRGKNGEGETGSHVVSQGIPLSQSTSSGGQKSQSNPSRTIGLFLLGGIGGVAIVRLFLFDGLESIGWQLFWAGLFSKDAQITNGQWDTVFRSTTFAKTIIGFVVGGFITVKFVPRSNK